LLTIFVVINLYCKFLLGEADLTGRDKLPAAQGLQKKQTRDFFSHAVELVDVLLLPSMLWRNNMLFVQ
jgi:hypothetical protein